MWVALLLLAAVLETSSGQFFGQKLQKLSPGFDNASKKDAERCFCQLKGNIDDCSCSVETLDSFNNNKIYPRLNSLLEKDYFRYFKVNLNKECPFWEDDSKCAMRYCSVQACTSIPPGLKGEAEAAKEDLSSTKDKSHLSDENCDNDDDDLGKLNTTISEDSKLSFKRWADHDDAQTNFCYLEDESSGATEYVDLLLNPEGYTGYAGPSAWRVWRTIYQENCFKPSTKLGPLGEMGDMCLEKRTFYRAVSGLHSSINIHLSARYLLSDSMGEGEWGPNLEEFQKRFDPEQTDGEGPLRLKNLYFLYLLELRAVAKAAPYLENQLYYTGNDYQDADTNNAVKDLLRVVKSFPEHFDERSLFAGGSQQAYKLKEEFRNHFRNISQIMDCVGCDKCKLWGKLQVTGLGTALKILFSGNFDHPPEEQLSLSAMKKTKFYLSRTEIVSLINSFGRLSRSIFELEIFRKMSGVGR